jgi:hypothetical protein
MTQRACSIHKNDCLTNYFIKMKTGNINNALGNDNIIYLEYRFVVKFVKF